MMQRDARRDARSGGTHPSGNGFIASAFHPTVQLLAAHQYATVGPDRRNLTVREQFVGAAVSDTQ